MRVCTVLFNKSVINKVRNPPKADFHLRCISHSSLVRAFLPADAGAVHPVLDTGGGVQHGVYPGHIGSERRALARWTRMGISGGYTPCTLGHGHQRCPYTLAPLPGIRQSRAFLGPSQEFVSSASRGLACGPHTWD